VRVLAINCSPGPGGKTKTALEAVLEGAAGAGATTSLVELGGRGPDLSEVVEQLEGADAFAFGTPMYRATYATAFKALLDQTPRGMYGEEQAPLMARATLTVATAASDHHFLGPSAMRDVLVDFFAAHVVSPGVYVPAYGFDESGALTPEHSEAARLQGRALVELARAIEASESLRAVRPNA
jgi:FMN reductase